MDTKVRCVSLIATSMLILSADAHGAGPARGFYQSTAIWDSRTIAVCWEDAGSFTAEHSWVADQIAKTWSFESELEFVGWGGCQPDSKGIRITVADVAEAPHTTGFGKEIDGKAGGMVLNFTFNNWSTPCKSQREFCIRAIAAHEFGHAIGFAHEQARPDTPGTCKERQPGGETPGDVTFGDWDSQSIMNYCNPSWNGDGELSPTDVAMVRKLYGAPLYSSDDRKNGGALGLGGPSSGGTVGDICRLHARRECKVRVMRDASGGHCESTGWMTPAANDCRCNYHIGLPAWQNQHCRINVFASPVKDDGGPEGCLPRCKGNATCKAGVCVKPLGQCPKPGQPECLCNGACMSPDSCRRVCGR